MRENCVERSKNKIDPKLHEYHATTCVQYSRGQEHKKETITKEGDKKSPTAGLSCPDPDNIHLTQLLGTSTGTNGS